MRLSNQMAKLKLILSISCVIIPIALSSCITWDSSSDEDETGEVVERSKEQSPAWIELKSATLHNTDVVLKYVEAKTKLSDLPLGIKRTQLSALNSSQRAFNQLVLDRIVDLAAKHSISLDKSTKELDTHVNDVVQLMHKNHARVIDIYFERRRNSTKIATASDRYYYKVYVLVHYPKEKLPLLYKELGKRFQKSRDQKIREISRHLNGLGNLTLSH